MVSLLNKLIKKDLEDIQKAQIKETIEKNIVDKEDDKVYIKFYVLYLAYTTSITIYSFCFFMGYRLGKSKSVESKQEVKSKCPMGFN